MKKKALAIAVFLALTTGACESDQDSALSDSAIAALIPSHVPSRALWARDVGNAIRALDKETNPERVCAVLAVIEQESGYQADPVVRDLPRIVRQGLAKRFERLGPLADSALKTLLDLRPPGSAQTFAQRIDQLRTERDLDRLFRDINGAYRQAMPGTYRIAGAMSVLFGKGSLQDLNPVTTAGSMQVKVRYALERSENRGRAEADVRDELYSRAGGIRYGTARLLDYSASYDDVIYRFADYNAGFFASRNAAVQAMLQDLTGQKLKLDGDLLAYDDEGEIKDIETESLKALRLFARDHGLWDWVMVYEVQMEKSRAFERSLTWWKLHRAWAKKMGRDAPYARLPDLAIDSPKLLRSRSTAWFAKSVKARYDRCRAKQRGISRS